MGRRPPGTSCITQQKQQRNVFCEVHTTGTRNSGVPFSLSEFQVAPLKNKDKDLVTKILSSSVILFYPPYNRTGSYDVNEKYALSDPRFVDNHDG